MTLRIDLPVRDTTWITRVDPDGIASCRSAPIGTDHGYSGGEKLAALQYQESGGVATITRLLVTLDLSRSTIPWNLLEDEQVELILYLHGYAAAGVTDVDLWLSSHQDDPGLEDYDAFTGVAPIAALSGWTTDRPNRFALPVADLRSVMEAGGLVKLMLRAAGDSTGAPPPVEAYSGACLLNREHPSQRPFLRARCRIDNPIEVSAEGGFKSGYLENNNVDWGGTASLAEAQVITPANALTTLPGDPATPLVWNREHDRIEAKPLIGVPGHSGGDLFAVLWGSTLNNRLFLFVLEFDPTTGADITLPLSEFDHWWEGVADPLPKNWSWDVGPAGLVLVVHSEPNASSYNGYSKVFGFRFNDGVGLWTYHPSVGDAQFSPSLDRRAYTQDIGDTHDTYPQVMDCCKKFTDTGTGLSPSSPSVFEIWWSESMTGGLRSQIKWRRVNLFWNLDGYPEQSLVTSGNSIQGQAEIEGGFTCVAVNSPWLAVCEVAGLAPLPSGFTPRGLMVWGAHGQPMDRGSNVLGSSLTISTGTTRIHDVRSADLTILRWYYHGGGVLNQPAIAILRLPCTFVILATAATYAFDGWTQGPPLGTPTASAGTIAPVSHDQFLVAWQEIQQVDALGGLVKNDYRCQLYQVTALGEPANPADCANSSYQQASSTSTTLWPEPKTVAEITNGGGMYSYRNLAPGLAAVPGGNSTLFFGLAGSISDPDNLDSIIRALWRDPSAVITSSTEDAGDLFVETTTPSIGVSNQYGAVGSVKRRAMLTFDLTAIPESIRKQISTASLRLSVTAVEATDGTTKVAVAASDFMNHDPAPGDYSRIGAATFATAAIAASGVTEIPLDMAVLESLRATPRISMALLEADYDRAGKMLESGTRHLVTLNGPGAGHALAPRLVLSVKENQPGGFVHRVSREDGERLGWPWFHGACHPRLPATQTECEAAGHQWSGGSCVDLALLDQSECDQGGFTWVGTRCQASVAIGILPCRCVDRTTNTWIVAAHEVEAVTALFATTPDASSPIRRTSGFQVTTASHPIGLEGKITVVTFLDDPPDPENGQVFVNLRGMKNSQGLLITNPVEVLEHFLTAFLGMTPADYDAQAFQEEAALATAWGIQAAGALTVEKTPQQVITDLARSFHATVFFDENGRFSFRFQGA